MNRTKSYPSAGRIAKMDFRTFFRSVFSYMEIGDEQESEEMAKKLVHCWRWTFLPSLFTFMEVEDEQKSEGIVKKLSQCW